MDSYTEKCEKRIQKSQREKKKIQKAFKKKEQEIEVIVQLYGEGCLFRAAERKWLYGE
ncbi:hypothetical protein [uncultured Acetatifactor sp.]|uniref:hypothetical protein n=1 Tax=uncultured Acetatifactor sp. TaxID=1671927 RepID=UPI00260F9C76|nr:hypothetical protein [uncultured Acetatifactor sp.]